MQELHEDVLCDQQPTSAFMVLAVMIGPRVEIEKFNLGGPCRPDFPLLWPLFWWC